MKKIITIIFFALLTCSCSSINKVTNNDIIKYLTSKYKDKGFYFIKESECNLFELGYCSSIFSSPILNDKIFTVSWKDGKGINMTDDFVEVLYEDELRNYYNKHFTSLNFQYNINVSLMDICEECNRDLITFDEYLDLVKNKRIVISIQTIDNLDNSSKYFHLKLNEKGVGNEQLNQAKNDIQKYIESKYDMGNISKVVTEIVNSKNLNNIYRVYFYLNDCLGDEYFISCSYTYDLYKK